VTQRSRFSSLYEQHSNKEENMTTHKTAIFIVALFGIVVLLAVSPVGAKDELNTAQNKTSMTEAAHTAKAKAKHGAPEKINVNAADLSVLSQVKGIGPKTAQNIINYRQEVGSFQALEDLLKVEGIGKETLEAIRPLVSVH
jgi:comEA protein